MPARKKKRGRPREKRRYRRKINLQPKTAEATIVAVETDTLETPKESLDVSSVESVSIIDTGGKDIPVVVETKDTFVFYKEKVSQISGLLNQFQRIQLIFLASIALGGLILGLLLISLLLGQENGTNVLPTQNPPAAKQETAAQTSAQTQPAVDLAKYSIKVLNGSQTTGEATRLKTALSSNGFKVSSAGDAPTANQEQTIIQAKQGVESAYLAKLNEFLSRFYVTTSQTLSSSEKSDIVIIVGNKTP